MKITKYLFILTAFIAAGIQSGYAQSTDSEHKGLLWSSLHGLDYEFKAGVNIGGTSPLPLPQEIRSLDSYSPGLAITLEGSATKWIDVQKKWGVSIGFRLDKKDMTTDATVKNYGMAIFNEVGGKVEGLWTGGVNTKVKMSLLTFPILARYQISKRWKLSAGPYFSYMMDGEFSGNVYEGHLRTPDATGTRIDFQGENTATYDFSNELRKFQWGLQVGGSWNAYRHLTVHADLTWGLNDMFKKDFNTISFAMYPIYLNLGFGYEF
jgi:hypothetical protein